MAAMAQSLDNRKATISRKETARRQAAGHRAEASLRLEGLTASKAAKAISELWERGEITGDEMTARIKALHSHRG